MQDDISNIVPVSVIIPAFNSGAWICDAIDSVLVQTVPAAQVIVIDDGSTDETAFLVKNYGTRVQYLFQPNRGVSAARNAGLQLARETFVAFLDADDVWHPCKLKMQLKMMVDSPEIVLLGTRSFNHPTETPDAVERAAGIYRVGWKQLVVKNHIVTSSVIARRDAIERAGLFDTELQGPEDRDLWLRLAKIGGVANLDARLTGYRQVQGSVSKQAARCYQSMRRIIEKLDETGQLRGQRLLRRKALSHIENSVACIWSESGDYAKAVRMLLRSFAYYPLPYGSSEADALLERPRRLAVYLLRMLGLKSHPASVAQQSVSRATSEEVLYA